MRRVAAYTLYLVGALVPALILYWLFIYRQPSERMVRLLDGDRDIVIEKITVSNLYGDKMAIVIDASGLEYFSDLLRKANKEGHVPTYQGRRHYSAIIQFGTFHSAKIGIYPNPTRTSFIIYYPSNEDSTIDIQYYSLPLDGAIPESIQNLYDQMRRGDVKQ